MIPKIELLEHASESELDLLRNAIVSRLIRDLAGPQDCGRDGWDLSCKALLWFLFSKGDFYFNRGIKFEDVKQYLINCIINTSHRYFKNEDKREPRSYGNHSK